MRRSESNKTDLDIYTIWNKINENANSNVYTDDTISWHTWYTHTKPLSYAL